MARWRHHTLKRIDLDSYTAIEAPEDWSFGYDAEKDRFWCGQEDGDVTLFFQRIVSEPNERDMGRAIPSNVARIVRFLSGLDGVQGQPEITASDESQACLVVVVDHLEDDVLFRTFRWYFFSLADSETLLELRFILSMPAALADEPAHRELVKIFTDQMSRGVKTFDPLSDPLWARVREWRRLPVADRAGCRSDWHRLRIVSPFGFVRMLAPESWPINKWDAEAGMWRLCDGPGEEVTLWVAYYLQDGAPADDELADDMESRWRADYSNRGRVRFESGGFVMRSLHMAEEKGEMLRYYNWAAVAPTRGGILLVSFTLVVSPGAQDTADEALLVRIFDEEIPRYRIREPSSPPSGRPIQ